MVMETITVWCKEMRAMTIKPVLWLLIAIGVAAFNTACTRQSSGLQPGSEPIVRPQDLSETESRAQSNLSAMVGEQFSIYSTQAQFSRTGSDFKGGFPSANQDYSYQIVQVTPTKVYMTATAKQANLRSLSAQVFVLPAAIRPQAYGNSPISGSICVTNSPSPSAPPEPADATVAEPPCPAGSSSLSVLYPQPNSTTRNPVSSTSVANKVHFSDSTFKDADWQLEIVTSGNGGTVAASQSNAPGEVGSFRVITNTVDQAYGGVNSNIFGLHWRVGATYNPQAQGAIAAIHYSEDAILIQGFGEGQAAGLALRQNQQVYLPVSRLITPKFNWSPKELRNLQAQDFVAIGTTNRHPDFSAAGAPIQLGFFRANTTTNKPYSITSGIDNWSVSISSTASAD